MDAPVDVTGILIDTDRLLLPPIAADDLEDMYAYASVPGVGEMAGWNHHESPEQTKVIIASMLQHREVLAIVHKADSKMIGTIGIHPSWANDAEEYRKYRVREIGYVLSKDYWGQGLMPEAVRAVIAYCFGTLQLDALTCCHFSENGQSRRVIEKCGFRFVRMGTYVSERLHKTFEDMQYILMKDECD